MRQWPARLAVFAFLAALNGEDWGQKELLLARVRAHMRPALDRLPNYTCVQTIERYLRREREKRASIVDRVRLEVAVVDGKELFSWPGARKFEDREIGEMVKGGAIGNGTFALHARSVFLGRSATFAYQGSTMLGDRAAVRWDYSVPLVLSGFNLRVGNDEALVAYRGSFWADPESLDVLRLEVEAQDIPPRLGLSGTKDVVEYARVQIAGVDFLLPRSGELHMIGFDGSESINLTRYTQCRQYAGESVLSFGDPEELSRQSAARAAPIELPSGLDLDLSLDQDVDLNTAAVGDAVRLRSTRDIKRRGAVVVPKGAQFIARFTLLRRQNTARAYYVVGIMLTEVEFGGRQGAVRAQLQNVPSIDSGYSTQGALRRAVIEAQETGNIFIANNTLGRLPRGLRMFWRTATQPIEETP